MRAAIKTENDLHAEPAQLSARLCGCGRRVVGFAVFRSFPLRAGRKSEHQPAKVYPPDAFVNIRPDGKIVIQVNRLEFGQGVHTSLPMMLADELDADWSQVVAELAPAADVYKDPLFGIQMVGGSGSIAHSFQQYRELGAKTRAMLVAAAADRWHVTPDNAAQKRVSCMDQAVNQRAMPNSRVTLHVRPVPANVRLKNPSEFRLIGKRVRRLDSRPKCDGSLKFGLDLDLPGMKVAVVAHPPVFGGRVKSIDDKDARGIEGVQGQSSRFRSRRARASLLSPTNSGPRNRRATG